MAPNTANFIAHPQYTFTSTKSYPFEVIDLIYDSSSTDANPMDVNLTTSSTSTASSGTRIVSTHLLSPLS